jgi:hypothetical protein
MSVSLQSVPTDIYKGTYYRCGSGLYYIKDIMPDGSHFLIENCYTNDIKWYSLQDFSKIRKEVIHANADRNR